MNIQRLLIGSAALAMTLSTAVLADDIYRWTDADGNVQYEDRPSGEPTEVRIQFSYNRTDEAAVEQRVQGQLDNTAARQQARVEAEAEQRSAAEKRALAEENMARCQTNRAKLKTILESRRVYSEDATGERSYLDEAARAESRSNAEALIAETCGS